MNQNKPSTILLRDKPSDTDKFGAHSRVANAILDLINSEEGGITIGLEGKWGSGKSTVVNLLKNQLEQLPQYNMVIFDAWSHQGDPLRRTFLETVLMQLQKTNWINDKYFQETEKLLTHREKLVKSKTIPHINGFSFILAFVTLLIPLSLTAFNSTLRFWIENSTMPGWIQRILLFGVAPTALFASFIFLAGLFFVVRGQQISKQSWALPFLQREMSITESESLETPNPTSVEFGNVFADMMLKALAISERKLVLVIDNLDRVASTDTISIISAMQTFLQHSEYNRPVWFSKLWVVIPYDRQALESIWKASLSDKNHIEKWTMSFIDKTFQIRFEVPGLLDSNWHEFLLESLHEAFPHEADHYELHKVYKVYVEFRRNNELDLPSPRDLKLFINQIGVIHRQWSGHIPLSQMAYYSLLRREHKRDDIREKLLSREIPENEFMYLFDGNIYDNLAAMLFNADVEVARQLLLGDKIQDALFSNNVEALQELHSHPGFWEVIGQIQFERFAVDDPSAIAHAALTIVESDLHLSSESQGIRTIRQVLQRAANSVSNWRPFNVRIAKGIICLIEFDVKQINVLHIIDSLSSTEYSDTSETLVIEWIDGLSCLFEALESLELAPSSITHAKLPFQIPDTIIALSHIYEIKATTILSKYVIPQIEQATLLRELANRIQHQTFRSTELNACRILGEIDFVEDWSPIIEEFMRRMHETGIDAELLYYSLTALWEIQAWNTSVSRQLRDLAEQGILLHHVYAQQGNVRNQALCIFVLLAMTRGIRVANWGNAQQGKQVLDRMFNEPHRCSEQISEFIKTIVTHHNPHWIYELLDHPDIPDRWVKECLVTAIAVYPNEFIDPSIINSRWSFFESAFDASDMNELISALSEEHDLASQASGIDFDIKKSNYYRAIIKHTKNANFSTWIIEQLQDLDSSTWKHALMEETDLVPLMLELINQCTERQEAISLGIQYQDAIVEYATEMMQNSVQPSKFPTMIEALPKALDDQRRTVMRRDIYKEMRQCNGRINRQFFDHFGEVLIDLDTMREDDNIILELFKPLLQVRNVRGLEWLSVALEKSGTSLKGFKPRSQVSDFQDRLEEAVKNGPKDDATPFIEKLADKVVYKRNK